MKIKDTLSVTSNVLGLALVGVKAVSDVRRHRTHAAHSQKCDCFALCYGCAFSSAVAQERARQAGGPVNAAPEAPAGFSRSWNR
jgi:hypothetical protein